MIAPEDWASAAEDLGTRILGRSPLAQLLAKAAGNIVFAKTGGNRRRSANKLPASPKPTKNKVLRLGNGVEYIPPPRSKT